jgi:hypothetical protein
LAGGALLTLAWTRRRVREQPLVPEDTPDRADGYREVLAR